MREMRELSKEELAERLPEFGALADKELDEINVPIKLISPLIDWEWYLYEFSAESGIGMAYVKGFENEIGTVAFSELKRLLLFIDDSYEEQTLKELTGW